MQRLLRLVGDGQRKPREPAADRCFAGWSQRHPGQRQDQQLQTPPDPVSEGRVDEAPETRSVCIGLY